MASLRDEIGDFVGIPISFMEDTKQTAESRVVFMVLRYHTNKKSKRAFPGYETIMTESGLSRQKTAEGIKVLVGTGWLVKHKQFAKVTEYELRYPTRALSSTEELQQDAPLVPPTNIVSSVSEQPPYSPEQDRSNKIKEKQPKPRKKEVYIEPPFQGDAFMNALTLFHSVQKKSIPAVRCQLIYNKMQPWGESVATQALLEAAEAGWPSVYFPKDHNGNGKVQTHQVGRRESSEPVAGLNPNLTSRIKRAF